MSFEDREASGRARCSASFAALVALVLLGPGCAGPDATQPRDERLNVVLVLSDALRAANLPWQGYPRDTAPNLSALARDSVVFPQHLANYPGTPVSVSQMQSGRFMPPLLMSAEYVAAPIRAIEDDLLVLPRALGEQGYATGLVSSHPWFDANARLLDHFDSAEIVAPPPGTVPYAPFEDLLPGALGFLDARAKDGRPFLLYVHGMDTHAPFLPHPEQGGWDGPEGFPEIFDLYDGEIRHVDAQVAKLLGRLEALGLMENTIFVFTSDHGEDLGELGEVWYNHGHGNTLRRSQVHVPLLVHAPKRLGLPSEWPGLSRHVDLAPTLLGLARSGVDLARYRLDGRDLSPALRGERAPEPPAESWAHSWRFDALFLPGREVVHDQWQGGSRLFRLQTDPHNYPVPVPEEPAGGELERLGERLEQQSAARRAEFDAIPPSYEKLGRAWIGVPTRLAGGSTPPSFGDSPDDDRWTYFLPKLLRAHPGESPPPLTLETPWAPGRYRVAVRLIAEGVAAGYAQEVVIHVHGLRSRSVIVDASQADSEGLVDLGEHDLGESFRVGFVGAEGGVAVTGFRLEHVGGAEPVAVDPEARERLRALGYVE